ncbi:hypothetical protein [Methanoculleus chikugoensis]|uniref:Uncharacterized protein n=1 Tax=Methanoculleus chikugoensis TaxID=118126 RepID=A0ABM7H2J8_9EURY|nr:hypothetical protein [Methanoculleus chikugoensis]BBL67017.1 hypothetical protein MchiMG62_01980 [Methanoculleus chikugoensis]
MLSFSDYANYRDKPCFLRDGGSGRRPTATNDAPGTRSLTPINPAEEIAAGLIRNREDPDDRRCLAAFEEI